MTMEIFSRFGPLLLGRL